MSCSERLNVSSGVATPGHTRVFARASLHFAWASENVVHFGLFSFPPFLPIHPRARTHLLDIVSHSNGYYYYSINYCAAINADYNAQV